jgi:hypothetical protein
MTCGFFFRCNTCNGEARSAPMRMPLGWIELRSTIADEQSNGQRNERTTVAHFCGSCAPAELGRIEASGAAVVR